MLGMDVAKGKNKLWVSKVNMEELKKRIHINDTIIAVNGERVGNDLSALRSPNRPLCIQLSRTVSVEIIEDETTEYYTDEEWTNGGDIPKGTGIDNSDIESLATNVTEENEKNSVKTEMNQWNQQRWTYGT